MKRAQVWHAGQRYNATETIGLALTVQVKPAALQAALRSLAHGGAWRSIEVDDSYGQSAHTTMLWVYEVSYASDMMDGERVTAEAVCAAAATVEGKIEQALEVKRHLRMLDHGE